MTTSAVAPHVFHRSLLALALIAACGTVAAQVIVTPPAPREGASATPPVKPAGVVVTPPAARNKAPVVVVPPATRRGVMNAHLEAAYPPGTWRAAGALTRSEEAQATALVLPLFHQMTDGEQERVVASLTCAVTG